MIREVLDLPLAPAIADFPHWGPMNVSRHLALCKRGIHLRVYVNGEDVSDRVRFFDDTPGHAYAVLYRLCAGRKYILRDASGVGPALEIVRSFLVREGEPFTGWA